MQDKIKACFTGCSFTVGEGFPLDQRDTYIYDRLVSKHFGFESKNLAVGGWGNYKIFMSTADVLISRAYEIVFVQWSGLNRLWLSPGPEIWYASNDSSGAGFRNSNIYINPKDRQKLNETLDILNHDYQNLLDLVDYTKILNVLADATGTKIVHINGLVPWQTDIAKTLDRRDLESFFSNYTKEILDFENKPDDEVCFYFNKLHAKFSELDQTRWVNLFDAFVDNLVDEGPEGHHPGIQSHRIMADKIINYLDKEMT